jgi:hypothetical protein
MVPKMSFNPIKKKKKLTFTFGELNDVFYEFFLKKNRKKVQLHAKVKSSFNLQCGYL